MKETFGPVVIDERRWGRDRIPGRVSGKWDMLFFSGAVEAEGREMTEIIVVGALVCLALVFLTRNLYNRFNGNSTCCCEGTVCLKKKKTDT
jgi:hypothetical protein